MITTNLEILRKVSQETSIEECEKLHIFPALEQVLRNHSEPGYGLSAIQIEQPIKAAIVRYKDLELNIINPVIEEMEEPIRFQNEGCLSLPGVRQDTERYRRVTMKWLDFDKKEERRAAFEDVEAIILQHEVDHLNGVLFIDRLAKKKVKIGRNEKCPLCISGRKYKHCCGR